MKNKKIKMLFLLTLIILLGLVVVLKGYNNQIAEVFSDDKVTLSPYNEPISVESTQQYTFDSYKGDILIGNKDGFKRVDKDGEVKWDQPFSMSNPRIRVQGDYILVADVGGTEFYTFNKSGLLYTKKVNNPILICNINESGNVTIIEENRDAHMLTVYDVRGEPSFKRNTTIDSSGYPTDLVMSPSGEQLVVNYLDVSDIQPKSNLVFFDLNYKSIYAVDQIVNAVELEGDIIGELICMGTNEYIAFTGSQIKGYKFVDEGVETFTKDLTNKIIDLAGSNDFFAVAYGESLAGVDEDLSGKIILYDKNGNKINNFNVEGQLSHVSLKKEQLIIGSNRTYLSVEKNGRVNWKYDATVDIKQIIPIDSDHVLIVWENNYQIFKEFRLY
ncbi:DUF5711 family protein [Vallitalea okinawensis]|uniref:DUF5711 family protein n=1 Tax=Vallitalea okinawensis TaxID=2078660 RepID=UPI000CFC149A|nr:DUF5711 family protein [Vallitalea okinawensis]